MLCIYSGGDSGFEERDALLHMAEGTGFSGNFWLSKQNITTVLINPPMPVLVVKL